VGAGVKRRRGGLGPLVGAYVAYGGFWGVWVVVFADFVAAHGLTPGGLSLEFTTLAVTAVAVMALLAPRLEPLPRRASVALALALNGVGVLAVGVASTEWLLPAFALLGVGTGLVDVFVNAAGHEIEEASGAAVLQWVHSAYGIGGFVGALGAGLALTGGSTVGAVILGAAALQLAAAGAAWSSAALRTSGDPERAADAFSLRAFRRWPALLIPGLVVMFAFFVEGSMDVWSVIFLRRTLGASILGGAAGFAAFALAIAVGRAFAARILFGMGYRRTILVAGLGSLGSGLVAVLAPNPVVAGVAFLGLGFFLSAAAPAAFGVAGGATPRGGLAIAAVTTVGYAGFVFGPPVMGWLADAVSLRATMVALVVVSFGIVAVAAVPGRRLWKAEPEREVEYPAVP
jgi:hypothetical protein